MTLLVGIPLQELQVVCGGVALGIAAFPSELPPLDLREAQVDGTGIAALVSDGRELVDLRLLEKDALSPQVFGVHLPFERANGNG